MKEFKKVINSFYLQDKLNPEVWELPNEKYMGDKDAQFYKLKPEIRKKLLQVADVFLKTIDQDIFIQDIILIGSLTGYNWSEFSDFDVHLLYDFNEAGENKELYEELFHLKKTLFNASHDIRIKGYEVEVFIQDSNEKEKSMGSYSLVSDTWIRKPKKENFEVDEKKIKEKAQQWMDIIDGVLENAEDEDLKDAIDLVKKYKEKLRKYRTCGLTKEGEYSYENLVFKFLRRTGYIKKLEDFKNKITDKKLSLENLNIE
jgi:hypothetical protein